VLILAEYKVLESECKFEDFVSVEKDPYAAVKDSHAIAIMTEWDEFKTYDYAKMYASMAKPAFIFDGRNILDHAKLKAIGFDVYAIGKPYDAVHRMDEL